jgi:RNA polymerase sigma-70 factor, ECF subfamily
MAIEKPAAHPDDELSRLLAEKRFALLSFIEHRLGAALRRKLEPEDIFQEVGAEAVRSWGQVSQLQGDRFSWLCELAERRIIDAHRRFFSAQKRSASREVPLAGGSADDSHGGLIDLLVASMTTPTQALRRNDREIRLGEALNTLPEEAREALRMRYVEQLPSKEIATRLGKSDGAVRVMLTRALRTLQGRLGPEDMPTFLGG